MPKELVTGWGYLAYVVRVVGPVIWIVGSIAGFTLPARADEWQAVRPPDACSLKLIGHRGNSFDAPENTLPSIHEALEAKTELIELDVQLTSDRVPVLMHDFSVARTTNGSGEVSGLTLAQIRELDAGSWKHPRYAGTAVPSLTDALRALRGRAGAYVDVKVPNVERQLRAALDQAGFEQSQFYVPIRSTSEMIQTKRVLPGARFVWFGGVEPGWSDSWLKRIALMGVRAIELHWANLAAQREDASKLIAAARAQGIEVWSYVINDASTARQAAQLGISAIETDVPNRLRAQLCRNTDTNMEDLRRVTGSWAFNQGSLRAMVGAAIQPWRSAGSRDFLHVLSTRHAGIAVPMKDAETVLFVPALTPNEGVLVFPELHHFGRGSGRFVNRYTLVLDLLRPQAAHGRWQALLQTSPGNDNDADLFIDNHGRVGVDGVYHGELITERWHRVAIAVDMEQGPSGVMYKYIDGTFVGTNDLDGIDGRWSLHSTIDTEHTLLFADDDGETAPLFVAAMQVRNYPMGADEVRALGSPQHEKSRRRSTHAAFTANR